MAYRPIESNALSDVKLAISVIGRSAVERVNNGISNKFLMRGSIIFNVEWQLVIGVGQNKLISKQRQRFMILRQF